MPSEVGMGARSVIWAAVGEGERVPMHGGRDVSLWSSVGEIAIPFLMAGTEMLHLKEKKKKRYMWHLKIQRRHRC